MRGGRTTTRMFGAIAVVSAVLVGAVDAQPAAAVNAHANWAGYHGVDDDGFTAGSGIVDVPQFSCPASVIVDHAVDLGWVADSPFVVGGFRLGVHCANGVLTLSAKALIVDPLTMHEPTASLSTVAAGHLLSTSFSYNSTTGRIRIRLTDATTGERVNVSTVHAGLKFTWTAFGLDYTGPPTIPPAPVVPVPTFTTMTIRGLTIDGTSAASKLVFDTADMYNGDHLLVRALPLNVAGKAFKLKFVAAT